MFARTQIVAASLGAVLLVSLFATASVARKTSRPAHAPEHARIIAFLGDSATSAVYSPPGYPALVGAIVGSPVYNLATVSDITGTVSYTIKQILAEQVPKIPADTTDAVLYLGLDDQGPLSTGQERLPDVQALYLKIIAVLKARKIRIHLVTIRNTSLDPNYANRPKEQFAEFQARMQRATDAFDNWILSLRYPTLDIRKYPDLMNSNAYQDGIHFNAHGISVMAQHLSKWFPPTQKAIAARARAARALAERNRAAKELGAAAPIADVPAPTATPFVVRLPHAPLHGPRVITFIGDAATSAFYSKPGFPAIVGEALQIPVHNLATTSKVRNTVSYHISEALREELPLVPPDTTDAVIFLGTDDFSVLADRPEVFSEIQNNFLNIIGTLKASGIRVFLIAPRDYSGDLDYINAPVEDKAAWQVSLRRASDRFDDWESSLGYPTLDMRKHADLSDNASYVHGIPLSPLGMQRISTYVAKWFQNCDAGGNCATVRSI